jgi:hypothetical protein
MSLEEQSTTVSESNVTETIPKYKLLPQVRKQLLNEFSLTQDCLGLLENKLGQEPYNMVTNRNGQRVPSSRWSIMVEQLWKLNKREDSFVINMTYEGETFNRRNIMTQSVFKTDLVASLRDQFESIGYNRVFINEVTRSFRGPDGERTEYQTFQLRVPV